MKKVLLVVALFLAALAAQAKGEKVKVLHNGHVIEVSVNALKAHVLHGDEPMVFYQDMWMTESDYQELLVTEYQQYQDATVEEEGEFDEEEGEY